ncbi:Beta-glucan synthesis-associated protein [Phytophthora megakarya]|uniref:Beta-glucan synthesis-associated protein n=1 Tax=Phytophthora megakarya TaxID=4795 RepID=A0A225WPW5_9STRA|nr:Beta-glucan synthesis-associated protein [Phytophthora megakarya]
MIKSRSGLWPWIDVDTPEDAYNLTSSRGETWKLVMSDEFNVPGRNFSPGVDHMWTALEMPDGVNAALEYYSVNMTSTVKESDGRGVFQIKTMEEENITYTVWNNYAKPAGFETHYMYYRAGMVQSWNKFCFQGGRMEVVAMLPGTTSSSNPDMGNVNGRVKTTGFYPTWPATTNATPSYNRVKGSVRVMAILAMDLILIKEEEHRKLIYWKEETIGANFPGIPTKTYAARNHDSWYQGLRYAPNSLCSVDGSLKQDPDTVIANVKKGITSNTCSGVNTCPASGDGYSDLDLIDGKGTRHWGVNDVGGCMPLINGYTGAFLCDPDSSNSKCSSPLGAEEPKSKVMAPFEYQMDAISANWPVQLAAYTSYLKYQVEWVMGPTGYLRWMLEDIVIFEIPSESVENVPQDDNNSNPKKLMLEEPMYVIFNVALSTSWGTSPPNAGSPCRGDGSNAQNNAICDGFPMYLKIDYIRIYQDLSANSSMSIGCDPSTHPTKQWIEDHIDEYETEDNKWIEVHGGANCKSDYDCTVGTSHILTGTCNRKGKCACGSSGSWGGPRCTTPLADTANGKGFGPPVVLSSLLGAFIIIVFAFVVYKIVSQRSRKAMVGAGITQPAILSKIEMDDIPHSNSGLSGTENKVV